MEYGGGTVLSDVPRYGDHTSYIDTLVELGAQLDPNIYYCKSISFCGKRIKIVTQNHNGPCPVIAILNALVLKDLVTIPFAAPILNVHQITELIGNCLLEMAPEFEDKELQASAEHNTSEAIGSLPELIQGLDVNPKFRSTEDFEITSKMVIFDAVHLRLHHGWLPDPKNISSKTYQMFQKLSYNQIMDKIVALYEGGESVKNIAPEEIEVVEDCYNWFLENSSQLTDYGIQQLTNNLIEGQIAIFFRNNHFATITKYRGSVYQLITDAGYKYESDFVWEKLERVDGNNALVGSDFGFPVPLQTPSMNPWGFPSMYNNYLNQSPISSVRPTPLNNNYFHETSFSEDVMPYTSNRLGYPTPASPGRISSTKAEEILKAAKEDLNDKKKSPITSQPVKSTTSEKRSTSSNIGDAKKSPLTGHWLDLEEELLEIELGSKESTKEPAKNVSSKPGSDNKHDNPPATTEPKTTISIPDSEARTGSRKITTDEMTDKIFRTIATYIRDNFPQVTQVDIGMNVEKDLHLDDVDRSDLFQFIMQEFNIELEMQQIWELKDLAVIVEVIRCKTYELYELNIRVHDSSHQSKAASMYPLPSVL